MIICRKSDAHDYLLDTYPFKLFIRFNQEFCLIIHFVWHLHCVDLCSMVGKRRAMGALETAGFQPDAAFVDLWPVIASWRLSP